MTIINIPTSLADLVHTSHSSLETLPASQKNRLSFIRFLFVQFEVFSLQSFFFSSPKVILVANEMAKEKIPEELGLALVLTVYEAKGLEFDDVLLYNFFTDSEVCHTEFFFRTACVCLNSTSTPGKSIWSCVEEFVAGDHFCFGASSMWCEVFCVWMCILTVAVDWFVVCPGLALPVPCPSLLSWIHLFRMPGTQVPASVFH